MTFGTHILQILSKNKLLVLCTFEFELVVFFLFFFTRQIFLALLMIFIAISGHFDHTPWWPRSPDFISQLWRKIGSGLETRLIDCIMLYVWNRNWWLSQYYTLMCWIKSLFLFWYFSSLPEQWSVYPIKAGAWPKQSDVTMTKSYGLYNNCALHNGHNCGDCLETNTH